MFLVSVAFLDLLGSAFLGFSFELFRVLTFAVTHFGSLLVAIDFGVPILDTDALRTWDEIGQFTRKFGQLI